MVSTPRCDTESESRLGRSARPSGVIPPSWRVAHPFGQVPTFCFEMTGRLRVGGVAFSSLPTVLLFVRSVGANQVIAVRARVRHGLKCRAVQRVRL